MVGLAGTDKAKLPMCLGETTYMGRAGTSAGNATSTYYGMGCISIMPPLYPREKSLLYTLVRSRNVRGYTI